MEIVNNGLHTQDGQFRHLWFDVVDDLGLRRYRAVALRELTVLSIDDSDLEEYNVLGRQWGAMRGLYNAHVDFVYTAAGIFTPDHVGVVQFYGAAADGLSQEEAAQQAESRLGAVEAVLANFQQSKTRSPKIEYMEWYLDFATHRAGSLVSILGHPDPRDARRGLNLDGKAASDDLAAEQNEMLFRGLAKLREDFIFQVTADHITQQKLIHSLTQVARETSNIASRRRGSISIGASLSIPITAALANSVGGSTARADSQAQSVADGQSHGWGQGHTDSYSHTESESSSVGGSETHTVGASHTDSTGQTESASQGVSGSHTDSQSNTDSRAHTESASHTDSRSHSDSHSTSDSVTDTTSSSVTSGSGSSWSAGQSSTWSSGHTESESQGQSSNWSEGQSSGTSDSESTNWGTGTSASTSTGHTDSTSETEGKSLNIGGNVGMDAGIGDISPVAGKVNVGVNGGVGISASESTGTSDSSSTSVGVSTSAGGGTGHTETTGASSSQGGGTSTSQGSSDSYSQGGSSSYSEGGSSFSSSSSGSAHSVGHSESRGTTDTVGSANTRGSADTVGSAESRGTADSAGWSQATGQAASTGRADGTSESHSYSKSWAYTKGQADTWGSADSKQESWGESHSEGLTNAVALGRGGATSLGRGFSTGLVPGISINRSWQTEDHVADQLTQILMQVQELFKAASHEGGFLTEAVLFTASQRGSTAAESLIPQAFHGPNTPTPVLTVAPQGADAETIRRHALAFCPTRQAASGDFLSGVLGGRFSTVLTAQQLAAYTAPAIFREGTVRVIPAIPKKGLGFYPDMPGDVVLGHQYSPETADLTNAPIRLDKNRFMHTMFAGATGFGKSVGAERLAYEIALRWKMRVVVLDFGAGWRKLLNAPGIEHLVDIRMLSPYGVRPLRWNPLQISRLVTPEVQMAAFVDIFGNVAQLGVKQQKHRFFDAVEDLYLRHGVLVNDPKVLNDPIWGRVQANEGHLAPAGAHLRNLTPEQCQAIAVQRSKAVSLQALFDDIEFRRDRMDARDQISRGVLDGILERLKTLLRGATAAQFAAGDDAVDVADLGDGDKRLLVLEGGKVLDQFSKAWLLSWAGWLICQDMVQKREKQLISGDAELVMVFEEANILFTGLSSQDEAAGGITVAEQYDNLFRDSRKYGIRFVTITQSPYLLPAGVRSSCTSIFAGFLAEPKDKDVVLAALAKSEKGFVDEPWRRFLSDANIGMLLGRLPYTFERQEMRPFLMQPLILNAQEPDDRAIIQRLGRIIL